MSQPKLFKVELPTDRWSARAISPYDIRDGIDARRGPVVVLHPGWGKSPERHARFLLRLADEGYFPVGVDTRYAYADRRAPRTSITKQPLVVGDTNPWFTSATKSDNRWQYRRPTALLDVCERLGIAERIYIGHSDGGRIVALASAADSEHTRHLVLVNAAGMGDSSHGTRRLTRSNVGRLSELVHGAEGGLASLKSAVGSVAYTLSHLRRTYEEKKVIQSTDTWQVVDKLKDDTVPVTVFHAMQDELISFEDCAAAAATRPWIDFIPTEGAHSNIYEDPVQSLIVSALHIHRPEFNSRD